MSFPTVRLAWVSIIAILAIAAHGSPPDAGGVHAASNPRPRLAYAEDRDFAAWQRELRAELRDILALSEQPSENVPWTAKRILATTDYTLDRIEFTAEPGHRVPGYLLRPLATKPPHRVMICLQGHSPGMHVSIGCKDPRRLDRVAAMEGGGTVSFFAGCVDSRIRLVVDSCSFRTYADSWMAVPHCACGYLPGLLKVADMPDLAGLIAPRGLLIVAGRDDKLARLSGVREGFEKARRIYRAAGAEDRVRLAVGNGGHRFYADDAWPVIEQMIADWASIDDAAEHKPANPLKNDSPRVSAFAHD